MCAESKFYFAAERDRVPSAMIPETIGMIIIHIKFIFSFFPEMTSVINTKAIAEMTAEICRDGSKRFFTLIGDDIHHSSQCCITIQCRRASPE